MRHNGKLHFGLEREVTPTEVGQPVDSGNGYYSYTYYELPFSYEGKLSETARGAVANILHKKHYRYPFTSCGPIFDIKYDADEQGGKLYYSVTYHHGD